MVDGKMKEIKKSVRRVYMKLFVLAAVAVFGAIAIAQAQKGINSSSEQADAAPVELSAPTPIPIKQATVAETPNDSGTALVNFEETLPPDDAAMPAYAEEPTAWDATPAHPDLPADSLPDELPAVMTDEAEAYAEPTLPAVDSDPYGQDVAYEEEFSDPQPTSLDEPSVAYSDEEFDPQGTAAQEFAPADEFDPVSEQQEFGAVYDQQGTDEFAPSDQPADLQPIEDVAEAPAALVPFDDAPPVLEADPIPPQTRVAEVPTIPQSSELEYSASIDEPLEAIDPVGVSAAQDFATIDAANDARIDVAARFSHTPTGKPGPQTMEGPQSPKLTLEKIAPDEVQVGQPTKFELRVRNTGQSVAENVVVRDEIPVGAEFIDSNPKATAVGQDAVYWEIGAIRPGEDVVVSIELTPTEEGQVGSVASVSFQTSATARTRVTKPQLVLEQTGPREALLGEAVRFSIKLSNPGSGVATGVVLEEDVPVGLSHSSGNKLEYEVGTIQPGQTRHLELTLKAAQAGPVVNTIVARAQGDLESTSSVELAVIAPKLTVDVEGPSKRYLDRQATFEVSVANPGTAPAHDVEVVANLPKGLQFVSTNNSGHYDQRRHAVIWSLEQLPAGEMGKAQFTAKPVEMGQYEIRAEGKAESGLESSDGHAIAVEGIAALFFGVADQVDPIEVGGRTTYEIKVVNQGSKAASNVRILAQAPEGMNPVSASGPTSEQIQGQLISFDPMTSLSPKGEAVFRITVQGAQPGDHRFRVQLSSDDMSSPVIKQEGTHIYSD